MKSKEEKTRRERIWVYLDPEVKDLTVQRAKDEGLSESALTVKALTLYLTKDVTDESLLIAKMSEIIRVVQNLAVSVDVGQKMDLEWIKYQMFFLPDPPSGEKLKAARTRAFTNAENFIRIFRERAKRLPRMLEAVFGTLLEEQEHPEEPQ